MFSERPNQIMGKLIVEVSYKQEKVLIESQNEVSSDMFMQRETYVNWKIPLNGYLNIFIGGIKNLQEGMNNIHYLTALNKNPDIQTSIHDWTFISTLCSKRLHDNWD